MQKIIEINTLEKDIKIEGFLKINKIEIKTSKNNTQYTFFGFTDGKTEITGNMFAVLPDHEKLLNKIVYVKLKTQVYNDKFSSIVDEIDLKIAPTPEIENQFIKYSSTPETHESLLKELPQIISQIKDIEIKRLCEYVFLEKYFNQFSTFPAAKTYHHNGKGGLLEHSLSLAKIGLELVKHYSYEMQLDSDLIVAGALFQDIGKIFEFEVDSTFSVNYSFLGSLKGHITISNEILFESLIDLKINTKQDKFARLSHIILSHHSQRELGSPVTPCIPEAIIIARVDKLDADMKSSLQAIKNTRETDLVTPRLPNLENSYLIKPTSTIYNSAIEETEIAIEKESEAPINNTPEPEGLF